ncbi:MAG: SDR family NAD(P)-dependent oxidoreductase, partial [Planktotalea arctica]
MSTHTAIITGGSKGIGADLGRRLIEKGYTVVSLSRGAPEWSDA